MKNFHYQVVLEKNSLGLAATFRASLRRCIVMPGCKLIREYLNDDPIEIRHFKCF